MAMTVGQRIQLKASLEGVSFAPAPDSTPSSSSASNGASPEAVPAAQPGKIDKVMLSLTYPQHTLNTHANFTKLAGKAGHVLRVFQANCSDMERVS